MKTFLSLVILILSIHANAQTEQPLPGSLSTYAPLNPGQGDSYLPVQLSNKNVASILTINNNGQTMERKVYNQEGWPVLTENTVQVIKYHYSPDKRKIKANDRFIYELDTKGNVLQYWEEDRYGNQQSKTVHKYDDKGNIIQTEKFKREQVKRGQFALKSVSLVTYKYDDKNRKITETGNAYEYSYNYNISNDQLTVSSFKNNEQLSAYTYNKEGILIHYQFFKYGTTSTQYSKTYNKQGLLTREKVTSTTPGNNKTNGYVITYRDGSVESPDAGELQFIDAKKTHNIYTKATTDFSIYEGFFEKGVLNGPGFMFRDGLQYKGNFKDGRLSGFGQTFLPLSEQTITFGIFDNGELNGYGFVTRGNTVVEAGMYKNGKLIKNLGEDLLSKKTSVNCEGNCTDGFGIKKENGSMTYTFFENGHEVGPYFIMKNNKMVQYGAKTKDFHFLEGTVDGSYYYGLWNSKKGKVKMLRKSTQATEAGIMKEGKFEKKYECIVK